MIKQKTTTVIVRNNSSVHRKSFQRVYPSLRIECNKCKLTLTEADWNRSQDRGHAIARKRIIHHWNITKKYQHTSNKWILDFKPSIPLTSSYQHDEEAQSVCDTDLLYSSVKVSQAKQENTQFSLTAWFGCYFPQTTCKCRHEISAALAFFQSVRSAVSGKTVKSCLFVFFKCAQLLQTARRWMKVQKKLTLWLYYYATLSLIKLKQVTSVLVNI